MVGRYNDCFNFKGELELLYVKLVASIMVALILYFLIEKKLKDKERFMGYFGIAVLLFVLST